MTSSRRSTALLHSTLALMLSTGGTSVLGILFWGLAAHIFTVSAVGRASAEISAMTLIASIAQLNLSTAFVRFLPRAGGRTRFAIVMSYLVCTVLAIAGSMIFLGTSLHRGIVPANFVMEAIFTAGVVLWTIFVIQDAALIALRGSKWVPLENISFGVIKLIILPLLVAAPLAEGVFLAWTIPIVIAVVGVNLLLFVVLVPRVVVKQRKVDTQDAFHFKTLVSFVTAEYLSSLIGTSATFLMPLVIIKELGASAAGYFYLPWLIGTSFSGLLWDITAPFIVEVSHDPTALPELLRRSLRLMAILVLPALIVVVVAAPWLLGILSHKYSTQGTILLRLIGLSFPSSAVISLAIASLWIRMRVWLLFVIRTLRSAALIVVSMLLMRKYGLSAVGLANLGVLGLLALAMLPTVMRWYHSNVVLEGGH
ncbi:MAG: oligosaccharide flippase family protein [Actinobacteria bacterium]|nr:oligosaccharide flippase family protein [Actinomycetota bacterium]MCL6094638.1 oligosaccharide flippase family protein [Actinomycetota bacterium]